MPLEEQMYCSQQICIPPSYPYILKQFAKAAIRTQPNDLLTWATSYFRCLALNIPPPIKPRLEYPIPRDYFGITPGWLRTLHTQLQYPETVSFKILWDRWIGACLPHPILVQILCLGGFDNNNSIPWYRFLGLCAGHLTDNLTQTLIMFCEILTDEPDGGSAMIPANIFLDIYKFLAGIDASKPQVLKNIYFTDDVLDLYKKEKKQVEKETSIELMGESRSASYIASIEEKKDEDTLTVISCPSIAKDEYFPIDEYLKILERKQVVGEDIDEGLVTMAQMPIVDEENIDEMDKVMDEEEMNENEFLEEKKIDEEKGEQEIEVTHQVEDIGVEIIKSIDEKPTIDVKDVEEHDLKQENLDLSVETKVSVDEKNQGVIVSNMEEGLKRLKDLDEMAGGNHQQSEEADVVAEEESILLDDLCQKSSIITTELNESINVEESQMDEEKLADETDSQLAVLYKEPEDDEMEKSVKEEEEEIYEEININAIPGIGPIVPEGLVEKVCEYFEELANEQYGMLMPRNIRHYTCPPLEVLD